MFLFELKGKKEIWFDKLQPYIILMKCCVSLLFYYVFFYGFTSALMDAYGHFSTQNLHLLQVTAVYYMVPFVRCQTVVFEVNIGLKRHCNDRNLENALVDKT